LRRSPFRHMMLGACLMAPFLLAGCAGGDEGVPQSFPPLRYTYLAPLSLNVGQIVTQVLYVPAADGSSVDAMSPESPLDAARQLIQDRLVAGGGGGIATVTINSASLTRVTDTVVGNISIHLTVRSADGRSSGVVDATATRTGTTPADTSPDAMRAFLYQLTQQLVSAENVELEYQIRQRLGSWLVGGGASAVGGPAAPIPVQAQDLGGASAPMAMPSTGGPTPLIAPAPMGTAAPMPQLVAPSQLTTPTPAPMAMPMTMPAVSAPAVAPEPPTVEMPSGSVGLPEGNPVPQYVPPPAATTAPVSLTPATSTPPPSAVPMPTPAPAPAAPASSSALPPLPAGITP
jgi:hypothetical protein